MSISEKRNAETLDFLMRQLDYVTVEASPIQKLLASPNRNLKRPTFTKLDPQEPKPASLTELEKRKTLSVSITDRDTVGLSTFYNNSGSPGLNILESLVSPKLGAGVSSILIKEKFASSTKKAGGAQIPPPIDERFLNPEEATRSKQKSMTSLMRNPSMRIKNTSNKGSPGLDPKGVLDVVSSKSKLESGGSQRVITGENDEVSMIQSPNTLRALDQVEKKGKKKKPMKKEYIIEKEIDAITKVALSNVIRRKSCCCSDCGGMSKFERQHGNVAVFSNREQYNAQRILEHKLLEQKLKERMRAYANSKNNGHLGGSAMSFRQLEGIEDISPISPSVRSKFNSVVNGIKFLAGMKREKSSPPQLVQAPLIKNLSSAEKATGYGKSKKNTINLDEKNSYPGTLAQIRSENESPANRGNVSQNRGTLLMNDGSSPVINKNSIANLEEKENLKFETLISGLVYKEADEDDSQLNLNTEGKSPSNPQKTFLLPKANDFRTLEPLNPERKGRELVPNLPLNIKVKNLMKSKSKSKRKDEIRYVLTTREDDGPKVVHLPTLENHPKSKGSSLGRKKSQKDMIKDAYGVNNDYDFRMPIVPQTARYRTVESSNIAKPDKIYIFDLETHPTMLSHSSTTKNVVAIRKKFSVDLRKTRDVDRIPLSTRVSQGRTRRDIAMTERDHTMTNEKSSFKVTSLLKTKTDGSFEHNWSRSKSIVRRLNPSLKIKSLEKHYQIQGTQGVQGHGKVLP